ncbi:hypothetical protein BKG89_00320 [Rodentibacter caecimuris]|uniref:Uncharacterized protein n=1 Tax=Rodentibacter caecimuris TaxID=1796644 RepID=A0ABX3L3Y9_9PAST|nr:hypothetical protein BKG89_00320 [Rodentibacter heylii]
MLPNETSIQSLAHKKEGAIAYGRIERTHQGYLAARYIYIGNIKRKRLHNTENLVTYFVI